MTMIKTLLLSSALVLGATVVNAQTTNPARPDQQNSQTGVGGASPATGGTAAPAGVSPLPRAGAGGGTNEPSRPDRGNSQAGANDASPAAGSASGAAAPAGVVPQPRAGAASSTTDPSRPDRGNSQTGASDSSPASPGTAKRN